MRKLALTALSVLLTISVIAQPGRLFDQQLKIKQMNVRITSDCFTATTFIEMEFYNNKPQEVEGAWFFRLHPGQVITSLQLDLHGKYRDGSIEERNQAANAYNTIVGKRIDPALLQYISADQYKLSVYPVPAKSSRKITMTIQQLLNEENGMLNYQLPIQGADSINNLNISIKTGNCHARPVTSPGFLANDVFSAWGKTYGMATEARNVKLPISLGFSIPTRGEAVLRTKESNGQKFFAIRLTPQESKPIPVNAGHLRVYWDVSLSGASRDKSKDIEFLEKYMVKHSLERITIVPFAAGKRQSVSFSSSSGKQWKRYLQDLKFEGGTRFDDLEFQTPSMEVIMVFSDGRKTLGDRPAGENWAPVFAISSSYNPDSNFLKKLPGNSGGRYIDLYRSSMEEALERSSFLQSGILNITALSSDTRVQISKTGTGESVLVYGTFKEQDDILVRYGNVNYVRSDSYPLEGSGDEGSAIDRIPMLLAYPRIMQSADWNGQLEFALEERVVTPRTSFIVLERVEDYVNYNITPPKELEEECKARGFVKKTNKQIKEEQQQRLEYNNLVNLMNGYSRLLVDFGIASTYLTVSEKSFQDHQRSVNSAQEVSDAKMNIAIEPVPVKEEDLQEVVVTTALGMKRQPRELGYATSKMESKELTRADVVNVQSGLTGKVSGLNVTTVNNGVFENTRMTLRGIRSLTGNNQPLLVLDGSTVPLQYLNQINPNDINDITILKGATASALYGSEGVNGVIVVNSKKYRETNYSRKYRLRDMPEEEYIQQLENTSLSLKVSEYSHLKKLHGHKSLFYVEAAQHLHAAGLKVKAKEVLLNAAEVSNNDPVVMRSIAFVLEQWGEFDDAISIYSALTGKDHQLIRDLAWCYNQSGRRQQAVDYLYESVKTLPMDLVQKAHLVDDMNAMIAADSSISTGKIPKELLVTKPADLRVVLSSNTQTFDSMNVETVANAGAAAWYDYLHIYQVKNASSGRYRISVRHADPNYVPVPMMIKMLVFKNFGKPSQTIEVENIIMNNQNGIVEIAEVKWSGR